MDKNIKNTLIGTGIVTVLAIGTSFISSEKVLGDQVYSRKNDNTLQVSKTEKKDIVASYDIDFLYEQRETIQAQKDRDNALRDAELKEVNKLIDEAEKLGIKKRDKEENKNDVGIE